MGIVISVLEISHVNTSPRGFSCLSVWFFLWNETNRYQDYITEPYTIKHIDTYLKKWKHAKITLFLVRHSYVATNLCKLKLFNLSMQITLCDKQNLYEKVHNNSRIRVLPACDFVNRKVNNWYRLSFTESLSCEYYNIAKFKAAT